MKIKKKKLNNFHYSAQSFQSVINTVIRVLNIDNIQQRFGMVYNATLVALLLPSV
jgi:hypothetical protein